MSLGVSATLFVCVLAVCKSAGAGGVFVSIGQYVRGYWILLAS